MCSPSTARHGEGIFRFPTVSFRVRCYLMVSAMSCCLIPYLRSEAELWRFMTWKPCCIPGDVLQLGSLNALCKNKRHVLWVNQVTVAVGVKPRCSDPLCISCQHRDPYIGPEKSGLPSLPILPGMIFLGADDFRWIVCERESLKRRH